MNTNLKEQWVLFKEIFKARVKVYESEFSKVLNPKRGKNG